MNIKLFFLLPFCGLFGLHSNINQSICCLIIMLILLYRGRLFFFSFMPQLDLAISFSLYSSLVTAFFIGYFFFLRVIFFPMTQSIKLLSRYSLYQLDFLSFFKSEENFLKKNLFGSFYVLLLCMDILKQIIVLYQRSFSSGGLQSGVEISSFVLPSVFLFKK